MDESSESSETELVTFLTVVSCMSLDDASESKAESVPFLTVDDSPRIKVLVPNTVTHSKWGYCIVLKSYQRWKQNQ